MSMQLEPTARAPVWQREPYRILFPLGAFLGVAGVLPWALVGLGTPSAWRPVFHSVIQVEGFLMSFALGFLFTFVPRRTGTALPRAREMILACTLPVAIGLTAWMDQVWLSQGLWILLVAHAVAFVVRRMIHAHKPDGPDGALIWVPISLGMGLAGAVLTGASALRGPVLHSVGQGLLTQGMFTGLCLGVGRMIIPMFVYGPRPRRTVHHARPRDVALHAAAAVLLFASFPLELVAPARLTWVLRALICLGMLVFSMRLFMLPKTPGAHRWLLWLSAWMLPLGYGLMAVFPQHRIAAEHVLFVGGFGLMVVAVSTHVVLAHGGHRELLMQWPWQIIAAGVLLIVALVFRGLLSLDPARFQLWLGLAAAAFLAAVLAWMMLLVKRLMPEGR